MRRDTGNGEYLRAYYETLPASPSPKGYQEFPDTVAGRAHDLLSTGDAVDFWYMLVYRAFRSINSLTCPGE